VLRDLKRLFALVETDELWLGVDDSEGRADKTEQIFSTLLSYCGEEGTPRKSDQGCNSFLSRETKSTRIKIYLQDQNLKTERRLRRA